MPTGAKPPLFSDFSLQWLATRAIVELKASVFREYETIVRRHLIPEFGHTLLPELAPQRIQEWIAASIAAGASPRTVRNRVIVLRRILDTAVDYGVLSRNVARLVGSIHIEPRDKKYLSPEQIRLLLDSTPASWRLLLALPALCGLRKSECLALEFDDISPGSMNIRITKSLRGGVVTSTKTTASVSSVPLPESLLPLIEQRRRQAGGHKLVFCRSDGSPLADSTPNRVLSAALDRAGLPHVRFHDLRSSWAIAHLQAGTDIKTLTALGRWSSPTTLLETYAAFIPSVGSDAVRKVDAMIKDR